MEKRFQRPYLTLYLVVLMTTSIFFLTCWQLLYRDRFFSFIDCQNLIILILYIASINKIMRQKSSIQLISLCLIFLTLTGLLCYFEHDLTLNPYGAFVWLLNIGFISGINWLLLPVKMCRKNALWYYLAAGYTGITTGFLVPVLWFFFLLALIVLAGTQ